jgi:hypothetical protein
MRTETHNPAWLAPRQVDARGGAVDEYVALQALAIDHLVGCCLEIMAATTRLRAGARKLVDDLGLGDEEVREAVIPVVTAAETALGEVQGEFHRLTLQVLRMGRYRLGLC